MQREIKFRVWDKLTNTMVGDGFHLFGEFMMFRLLETYIIEHPVPHSVNSGLEYELWRYENIEVMQFTGLIDKNGKEIYEDDIVNAFKKPYEDSPTINEVKFVRGCWRLVCKGIGDVPLFNYSSSDIEVMGDLHSNPELLSK